MANKQIKYGIGFNVDKSGLQEVKSELMSLQKMSYSEFSLISDENLTKTRGQFEAIKRDVKSLENAIDVAFNPKLDTVNLDKFNQSIKNLNLQRIEQSFSSMGTKGKKAFVDISKQLLTTKTELKQTSKVLDSMATTLGNTIKWSVASGAINTFTGAIRNAWNYTKSLDKSLNDIRIVTEKSSEDMEKFAVKANNAAKALGTATTAYSKASLIYYQQGLDEEDVQARTNVTIKAANVTGQSTAKVSEQLTAVWNGYKVVAEEAELYIDKLSAVAAKTAADLEELSEGMSKVASGANAMGVDIDQLTAQLSTIVSVTRQDASSVGTALKTIFARMGDLKVDGVDEFGVSLGEVSGTLQKVGIDILDQEGNLRKMGTVMEEVAGKWGTWTEAQQQAIAVAMAGKRQYNNLLALFENWDMYESALLTSQNSAGTLQKQQDIYMESIEARLERLGAAGEKVFDAFFNSDSMKALIDGLTEVVDHFGHFVRAIGGGGNLLLGLGGIATKVFNNQISTGITRIISNLRIAKESQLQYNAQLEMQQKFANLDNDAYQKMAEIKKIELANAERLTDEEKKTLNILIEQTAELEKQRIDREARVQNAEEYIQDYGEGGLSKKQVLNRLKGDTFIDQVTGEEKRKKGGKRGSIEVLSTEIDKINKSTKTKTSRASVANAQEDLKNEKASETKKKKATQTLKAANKEIETLQKLATSDKVNIATKEQAQVIIESTNNVSDKKEQLIKLLENEVNTQKRVVKALEEGEQAQEEYNRSSEEINENVESLQKTVETRKIVEGFTSIAGGAMQAASAITMLVNGFKSLNDDSLTDWEKFSGLMTTIISATPMLIMAFGGIKTGLKSLALAAKKTGDEGAKMWTKILGPVIAVVAAIAAVIAIIILLKSAFDRAADDGKKAFEAASEAAQEATEELQRTKKAADELREAFEKYDRAQQAIEDLTIGTEEWKKAIQDSNQEVLELLDKYPQLAEYISNVNGQLKISNEGREFLEEKSNNAIAIATSASNTAQAKKLSAKNSMIAQEASTEYLKNVYIAATDNVVDENTRDKAYQSAIDIVNKQGNWILSSYEDFSKEMKAQGVIYPELINALWNTKDELSKNAMQIAANTEAIKIQEQQAAANFLSANSQEYQNSRYQTSINKLFSQETGINSEAYENAEDDLEGRKGFDSDDYADEYAELMNINYETVESDDGKTVYKNSKGETVAEISDDAMLNALASNKAQIENLEKIKKYNQALEAVSQSMYNNSEKNDRMTEVMANFVAGEIGDISSLTKGEAGQLLKNVQISDEDAEILGYKNADDYRDSVEKAIENYNKELENITIGLNQSVQNAFNEIGQGKNGKFFDDLSLATQKSIANGLQNAFKNGGSKAIAALRDFYNNLGDVTEEDLSKISQAATNIDWTTSGAMLDFKNLLKDINVQINEDALEKLAEQMSNVVNVTQDVLNNLQSIRKELATFSSISKELTIGATITDEDYNTLVKHNKEFEKFFVMTIDGYKYLGGADNAIAAAQSGILNYNKIKTEMSSAANEYGAGEEFSTLFNTLGASKEQKESSLFALLKSGEYNNLISASGVDSIDLATALGFESSIVDFGNGISYTQKELSQMGANELAEKTGKTIEDAQNYINSASKQIKENNNLIESSFAAISNAAELIESGDWLKKQKEAEGLFYSSLAKNYSELKAYKNEMSEDVYKNLANVYLAEEAAQLGINTKAWEALTKATIEDKEAIINRRKLIQAYDEVNFYNKYEKEINKINRTLDNLAETQDKLFGKNATDNLKKQIELQKDLLDISKEQYDTHREEMNLRRQSIQETYGSSLQNYGIVIDFDENGGISDDTVSQLLNKLKQDNLSEEERVYIQTVLDEIELFNEKIIEGLETYKDTFKSSMNAIVDAAMEIFDQELKLTIDLNNVQYQIKKIKTEIEDIILNEDGKASLSFFGEKTATDMYEGSVAELEYLKEQLSIVENAFNSMKEGYEKLGQEISDFNDLEVILTGEDGQEYSSKTIAGKITEQRNIVDSEKKRYEDALNTQEKQEAEKKAREQAFYAEREKADAAEADYNAKQAKYLAAQKIESDAEARKKQATEKQREFINTTVATYWEQHGVGAGPFNQGRTFKDYFNELMSGSDLDEDVEEYQDTEDIIAALADPEKREAVKKNLKNSLIGLQDGVGHVFDDITSAEGDELAAAVTIFDSIFGAEGVNITKADQDIIDKKNAETFKKDADKAYNDWQNLIGEGSDYANALSAWENYEVIIADPTKYNEAIKKLDQLQQIQTQLETERLNAIKEQVASFDETMQRYLVTIEDAETGELKFEQNTTLYFEDMKESWNQLSDYYNQINEQLNTIYESWGKAQEEILNAYDKEIEKRSKLNSLLSSAANLYQLAGKKGVGYSDQISNFYEKMAVNSKNSYLMAKAQLEATEAQYLATKQDFENGIANQSMMDIVEANYNAAMENMMSTATEWANALQQQLSMSLTGIMDEFVAKSSELGLGLNEMQEEWSRAVAQDERYLDAVNASYAIGELERSFQKSIDSTDNYTAQKKLNTVLQEQLKILREKDKLSQYDIDRANAMYELTLKQIALEESQQTASKMKLTRDASGNYSYQYVSDQDKIAEAEAELAKAQNDLYNLDKERQKSLVDDYYNIMSEAQQAISEASEENRANVAAYYEELLKGIQSELGISTENLKDMEKILTENDWTAPFENFAAAISGNDIDNMFEKISDAINGAEGLSVILDDALGTGSKFTAGMTNLENALNDPNVINNIASVSASTAEAVIENLPALLAQQKILDETINSYKGVFESLEADAKSEIQLLQDISGYTKTTSEKDFSPVVHINGDSISSTLGDQDAN